MQHIRRESGWNMIKMQLLHIQNMEVISSNVCLLYKQKSEYLL